MKKVSTVVFIIGVLWLSASQSLAHKVIVYAWVDNKMIHVEGSFGKDRPVHQGKITVLDKDGTVVFKGTTNDSGYLAFPVPPAVESDLEIVLDAGTAHRATWRIPLEELNLQAPLPETPGKSPDQTTRESLEKGPSPARIAGGIAIIFILALGYRRYKKRDRR